MPLYIISCCVLSSTRPSTANNQQRPQTLLCQYSEASYRLWQWAAAAADVSHFVQTAPAVARLVTRMWWQGQQDWRCALFPRSHWTAWALSQGHPHFQRYGCTASCLAAEILKAAWPPRQEALKDSDSPLIFRLGGPGNEHVAFAPSKRWRRTSETTSVTQPAVRMRTGSSD